jgi:hypothetical protein
MRFNIESCGRSTRMSIAARIVIASPGTMLM